ncbi:MAG TPA: hypothetical protein VNP94_02710 [Actinomycetota bacterium]|nr:hypothetical protein [Actinomycetota bacterium]
MRGGTLPGPLGHRREHRAPRARAPFRLALALLLAAALPAGSPLPAQAGRGAPLAAYRGLGAWVDIYDEAQMADPEGTVQRMAAYGVRTVYFETSNYSREQVIVWRDAAGRFIEAAHAAGMRIVAWYLPGFENLRRDLRRTRAAIAFESPSGQRFDSFALDIEATVVDDPAERTRRLLRLSRRIRELVGPAYPLGAITPNPVRLVVYPDRWPGFPWRELARIYDVFLPMTYFGYDVEGRARAYAYVRRAVELIREQTGIANVPIHAIGGIANDLDAGEVEGYVRAAREHGLLGASLYDFDTSGPEDWAELAGFPVNPRQSPPLPVPVGATPAMGNLPRGDRTHPKEVFFRAGPLAGSWTLRFQLFDLQAGEVSVWANWRKVADLTAGRRNRWSATRSVTLPDEVLRDGAENSIAFVAAGDFPDWSVWGVRAVELVGGAPAAQPVAAQAAQSEQVGAATMRWSRTYGLLPVWSTTPAANPSPTRSPSHAA